MNAGSDQDSTRAWRYGRVGSVILSPDFLIGVPVGAASGAIVAFNAAASSAAVAILLAMLAVDIALVSVVIAAHTLVSTLASPEYLQLIAAARGGLREFSRPYLFVVYIATAGAVLALLAALCWPTLDFPADCGWESRRAG